LPTTTTARPTGVPASSRDAGAQRRLTRKYLQRVRNGVPAVLFALPVLLVFLVFSWGPIVKGLVMSVQQTNLVDPVKWVGLENFRYVLTDPAVGQASLNTLWFTLLALLFGFPVPVLLAMFLSELRGRSWLYTTLAYLPVITPPVVAILLWRFFYDPSPNGMFNSILGAVGLGPFLWLDSPGSAMPSIVLEATWAGAGNAVIIYLAALTSVRTDLYEAAELDGAGVVRRVWHVMLPHLRSVLLLMLLLQVIGTMQLFTEPLLFTGGGPQGSTMTILLLIYNYAFVNGDYGAATALSVLLALALAVLSAVFQLATRGWSTA